MHREAEKFYPNGWRLPSVKELEEIYSSHKNSFSRGFSFRSCERNDNDRCLRVFFEERTNRCQTCDDEQLLPVILLREVAAPSVHASEKGSAIYQAPAGFGGEKENQVGAAAAEAADSNERKMAEGIARETRKLEAMLDEDEDKPKSSVLICYTKSFKYQVLEGEFNLDGMHREAQRFYRDGWRLPSVEHLKEIYNRHKKYFTPGISFRSYERDEHNKCMRVFFDKGGSYTHTCTDTQPLPVRLVREPAPLTVYLPDNWLTEGPVR
jgi:hypothetical protein